LFTSYDIAFSSDDILITDQHKGEKHNSSTDYDWKKTNVLLLLLW